MNKYIAIGRLTKMPEMRMTQNGKACVNFTLAVQRKRKSEDGVSNADFIQCIAWGKNAENIYQFVKKGHLLAICGEIRTGSYEANGGKVYTWNVEVHEFNFLERKDKTLEAEQELPF